ncbi:hypothetical protein CEP52_005684 [Fusarium oligoseptatum]|uniref:DUF1446 domain-containing protein n=1 Tax=Fusarium oligoseptatum TaxID=2604345 RepID=A0A428TWT2_9HYPO|nr:hypothetical protein CEP52_005684 [Fusarium oligoseptatum]
MPPIRIGCYGAFWGDSPWAINQFLKGPDKQVDYLVADYLAEVTMGLLARSARSNQGSQKKRPAAGSITEFADLALLPNLDAIIEKGIKLVTNAGGLHPVGLKEYIESKLAERGLSHKLKVAAVHGDDIIGEKETLLKDGRFHQFDPVAGSVEEGINAATGYLSLNAYLGAQPIAVALKQGADIVITGRCVDSALVLGPLTHELGWNFGTSPGDLDRLASASLAGHIIECGAQATGGNYTDWEQSAFSPHGGWANMGYPILTFFPDNSFTISKPPRTGGVVNTRSVCEQMLYEVLDTENYILPDVILDLSRVTISQSSPDSVLVRGAKGKSPTPWLKCTAVRQQGYRISVDMLVSGEQAERKAKTLGRAIVERTNALAAANHASPISNDDHEIIVIGAEHHLGSGGRSGERREVVLRVAARHEKRAVLDMMGKEAASFLTNSAPGICMLTSGRPKTSPNFVGSSALVRRDSLHPVVFVSSQASPIDVPLTLDGCLSGKPSASLLSETAASGVVLSPTQPPQGVTWRAKLHEVATGRSGDKGDSANVAIIARDAAFYEHILQQVTPQVVFSALQHLIGPGGTVTRFAVPGVNAVNFVITKALGGGGLSSLRLDRQAKSYAQLLLSLVYVDIPADVAHAAHL